MNAKIVNLPSIVGNKLSFNKMLETQLTQLVVINMSFKHGNFLCLPKTFAKFSVVLTREENPLMVRHIPMWLQRRQLRKTRLMRHKKRSYQHKMTTSNSIKRWLYMSTTSPTIWKVFWARRSTGLQPCNNSGRHFHHDKRFLHIVDFMVLDMEVDKKLSLILGSPFLSTAHATMVRDFFIGFIGNVNVRERNRLSKFCIRTGIE